MSAPDDDFWTALRQTTQARIGLGRTGDALPTRQVLELRAAHASARDAVHEPLDVDAFTAAVTEVAQRHGWGEAVAVTSRAATRGDYLRRPDLGRVPDDLDGLPAPPANGYDVGIVLADGLSPRALGDHGPGLLDALATHCPSGLSVAPPVVATQARVALGDHVGEALGVRTLLVLIGERPGLSVADSLGIYLTHEPRAGRRDSERNCISNIHPPEGLGYDQAAEVAMLLVTGARELGASGVRLKDTSGAAAALDAADQG